MAKSIQLSEVSETEERYGAGRDAVQIWLRSGPIFAYVLVTFDFNSIEKC